MGDPGAGIADLDDDPAVDVPRTNDQSLRIVVRSFHRLDPIAHQWLKSIIRNIGARCPAPAVFLTILAVVLAEE
jgi:hypothetical protein